MSDTSQEISDTTLQRNIVICSDGTWQKGGQSTPTNVWRTYLAVEEEGQFKFHDDGVGSDGFKLQRIVAGAFGLGISRNLVRLIEALIKTYKPGTHIYLFGFSRGAFTVRVLADLICRLGIPPGKGKSPEEIRASAQDLLLAYKFQNKGNEKATPSPRLAETTASKSPDHNLDEQQDLDQPDSGVALKEWQQEHIAKVMAETQSNQSAVDRKFAVHFVGCWDTVEAVGLPTDILKKSAIKFLFPLRFSNKYPSPRVRHLYHALSLDDERHTFHPLLWETPPCDGLADGQRMEQVWFAGGHAHVGGGFAKDQLALTPLDWMLSKATAAGLRLNKPMLERFRSETCRYGAMHPSRPGLYKFYRFRPRRLSDLVSKADVADCRVHQSVLDRIAQNTDYYAPTAIDIPFKVVKTHRPNSPQELPADEAALLLPEKFSDDIKTANEKYIEWRCHLYRVCVALWIGLIVWCLWWNTSHFGSQVFQPKPILDFMPNAISFMTNCVYSAEHCFLIVVEAFVPAFVGDTAIRWLKNLPGTLTVFTGIFALLLAYGRWLRARTRELSLRAWHESGVLPKTESSAESEQRFERSTVKHINWGAITFATCCIIGFFIFAWFGWKPYHAHLDSPTESPDVSSQTLSYPSLDDRV